MLVLSTSLTLSACGPGVGSDGERRMATAPPTTDAPGTTEAAEAVTNASWDDWTGVYGEIRPATDKVVGELRARVAELNASEWTAYEGVSGAEISYRPDHLRASWGFLDLHLDPRGELDETPFVVCEQDGGCTEMDPQDDDAVDVQALADTVVTAYALLAAQLASDEPLDDILEEGFATSVATVESPIGNLDCLLHAPPDSDVQDLVGTEVVASPDGSVEEAFVSRCVDARGLVVLDATSFPITLQYESWRPGVDDDVAELVAPDGVEAPPVDPTGEVDGVRWSAWEGVFRDVRPATKADVVALRDRIVARNRTSWTGVIADSGTELTYTPTHVRVVTGEGYLELHLDPRKVDTGRGWFQSSYVFCLSGEEISCARVTSGSSSDLPHLVNNGVDTLLYGQMALVVRQSAAPVRRSGRTVAATVDSPVGSLDCLVDGDPDALAELEGAKVPSVTEPWVGGPGAPWPTCVDGRGLVVISPDALDPVTEYASWREGVDGDVREYPAPVVDYNDLMNAG
jgi:hypothetical protein